MHVVESIDIISSPEAKITKLTTNVEHMCVVDKQLNVKNNDIFSFIPVL